MFFGDEIFQIIPNNVCVEVSLSPAKELLHVPVHFDCEYPRTCSEEVRVDVLKDRVRNRTGKIGDLLI